jgi:hypothetical protein
LWLTATPAFSQLVIGGHAYAGECNTDDEVPAAERSQYEQPAIDLVRLILSGKAEEAYNEMSDEAQLTQPLSDFRSLVLTLTHELPGGLQDLHIEHSYRETLTSFGDTQSSTIVCSLVAHGSIAKPEGRVAIRVTAVHHQAYVIVSGRARNNDWSFVVWLTGDKDKWAVGAFNASIASVLHRSAQDLWAMARDEARKGHSFNAYVL